MIKNLNKQIRCESIAVFRICFGLLVCWEVLTLWHKGHVFSQYVESTFHFQFPGFSWVAAFPGTAMYLPFIAILFFAILVAVGHFYRIAITGLFLSWTYLFLVDQCNYQNHYYLLCLIPFLMMFIPADRTLSLKATLGEMNGKQERPFVSAWCLQILRFQIAIPYLYGAVYKMHSDWLWLNEPMNVWLKEKSTFPLIGTWLTTAQAAFVFSWGGMLFDLLIIPLLLCRKTRVSAVIAAVAFHLTNSQLFNIGVFPWFSIAALTLFLVPEWPVSIFGLGPDSTKTGTSPVDPEKIDVPIWIYVFVAIQLLFPLRHWMYSDWVLWNDRGNYFAWNMKPKRITSGKQFMAVDHQKKSQWMLQPEKDLTAFQLSRFNRPDMYRQYAIRYAENYKRQTGNDVEVYVSAFRGLNGRKPIPLTDPKVDLAKTGLFSSNWIMPFEESEYPFATGEFFSGSESKDSKKESR